MGCFAATCCISGLPIDAGDEVRWLLLTENPYNEGGFLCETHGRWVPRTWPIKAKYNHYGSIEDYEEGALLNSIMQGLQIDLVEMGVGNNSVHDVESKKDMSFDHLLTAVWEGRVKVLRKVGMTSAQEMRERMARLKGEEAPVWPPPYIPTLQNVEAALSDVPIPENARFLVDEQDNWTRVRWDGLRAEFNQDMKWLKLAQERLQETFATVITADHLNNKAALRVFVAPGKTEEGHPRNSTWQEKAGKTLLVQQAMIREDVWQALINLPFTTWHGTKMAEDYRQGARIFVEKALESIRNWSEKASSFTDEVRRLRFLLMDAGNGGRPGSGLASDDLIPFSVGLATHARIVLESGDAPEDFGDLIGEFNFIFALMQWNRYVWRPGDTCGPQDGEWVPQVKLHRALLEVAEKGALEEAQNRAEWGEDDVEERDPESDLRVLANHVKQHLYTWLLPADLGIKYGVDRGDKWEAANTSVEEILTIIKMEPMDDGVKVEEHTEKQREYARDLWEKLGPFIRNQAK